MTRNTVFAQVTDPRGETRRTRREFSTFERLETAGDPALLGRRADREDTPGPAFQPGPFQH